MKQGKRPTKRHKVAMIAAGLKPVEWLVTKNLESELHIVQKITGKEKVIPA